ncbi:MAG TPA: P-loop NTPase fold protein [bacterium]|nr:P-loop NTPase fold protein [bacterium]
MQREELQIDEQNWDAADQFLNMLRNRGTPAKMAKGESDAGANGFVVLVHQARSLHTLQSLCMDQTEFRCLTARYRLQGPPVLGTLLASFIADMQQLRSDAPETQGSFQPGPDSELWHRLVSQGFFEELSKYTDLHQNGRGDLSIEWLKRFNKIISNPKTLTPDDRIVMFGEIIDFPDEFTEFESSLRTVLPLLPEQLGVVLLGLPEEYHLPSDEPNFLEIEWQEGSEDVPEGAERAYSYKVSSLQDDQPARRDLLDVRQYAVGLARLILHEQTNPLTIGIQAPWGKGKSSFMQFVDRELIRWAPSNKSSLAPEIDALEEQLRQNKAKSSAFLTESRRNKPTGEQQAEEKALTEERKKLEDQHETLWQRMRTKALDDVVTVHFNAWQYEDTQQIWAGLASRISRALEEAIPGFWRWLTPLAYTWQNQKTELVVSLIIPVLGALLIGLGLVLGYQAEVAGMVSQAITQNQLPQWFDIAKLFLPIGSGLFLFWFIAWRVLSVLHPVSRRVLEYIRLPDYRNQMGFQHRVLADLQFMYNRLKRWRHSPRVVIFIDDLDRCSEEKIMEMLQAINLILGESDFFVLLGIDTEMLYRAIRSYYTENQPEHSLPENFPENYLRKIIQLPFHLPEFPTNVRFSLVRHLFSPDAQRAFQQHEDNKKIEEVIASSPPEEEMEETLHYDLSVLRELSIQELEPVEDTVAELEAYGDYQKFLDDNPREVKRLVNVHRLVKILLQMRHSNVVWSEHQQRKLVKWLIFCARWPDLIDDVLRFAQEQKNSPNCLADLAGTLPDDIRDQLREYAHPADPGDIISAQDLQPDGHFHLAAYFSHLIREEDDTRTIPAEG